MSVKKHRQQRNRRDPVMQQKSHQTEAAARIAAMNVVIHRIGVGQRALAEKAGIAQSHVNRVLTGHVMRPTFWTLLRMEQAVEHYRLLVEKK